jgi:hypothetical protein
MEKQLLRGSEQNGLDDLSRAIEELATVRSFAP